jgi:hypothetical protein
MKFVFSLDQKGVSLTMGSYFEMMNHLDVNYTFGKGSYKGTVESSIMTERLSPLEASRLEATLVHLLKCYNQESYLKVHDNGRVILQYLDGTSENIGDWQAISEQDAKVKDAWSKFNDTYYVATKE